MTDPLSRAGLVIVDKPAGMTSHDVVSRCRRIFSTRKVGHAGTLDPMATGVLVIGIERATKIMGLLTLTTKSYAATIRFGQSTSTDDAEGEVLQTISASHLTEVDIEAAVAGLRGDIAQVPSSVSAIKVDGQRAYKLARKVNRSSWPRVRCTSPGSTCWACDIQMMGWLMWMWKSTAARGPIFVRSPGMRGPRSVWADT